MNAPRCKHTSQITFAIYWISESVRSKEIMHLSYLKHRLPLCQLQPLFLLAWFKPLAVNCAFGLIVSFGSLSGWFESRASWDLASALSVCTSSISSRNYLAIFSTLSPSASVVSSSSLISTVFDLPSAPLLRREISSQNARLTTSSLTYTFHWDSVIWVTKLIKIQSNYKMAIGWSIGCTGFMIICECENHFLN